MLYRPFLSTLPPAAAEELVGNRPVRTYYRDDHLLHQGSPGSEVLILVTGWVAVVSVAPSGVEAILAIRGPADVVGELAAIDAQPRSTTVRALGEVTAAVVPGAAFVARMSADPQLSQVMFRHLAGRQRDADSKHAEHATTEALPRVAARLVELADRYGRPAGEGLVDLALHLGHQELGKLAGVRKRQFTRIIHVLKERDIVREPVRGRLTVVRPDALREIVLPKAP
jgi:CRP-like cAMP-binding protein